jgi:hypothetical protein
MPSKFLSPSRSVQCLPLYQSHVARQHRRIHKQPISIPHDRILQLAMESREARIEREKLLRQSHLVRTRNQELSLDLKKLKEQAVSPLLLVVNT